MTLQRGLETVQTLLTTGNAYAVVLEMVAGGDLFDYLIQKAPHGLPECVSFPSLFYHPSSSGMQLCDDLLMASRNLRVWYMPLAVACVNSQTRGAAIFPADMRWCGILPL